MGSSALAALSPYSHASLSITANYLRPVPAGRRIRCAGAVTELGRTVATMSVSLYDTGDDALLAQGTRIKVRNVGAPRRGARMGRWWGAGNVACLAGCRAGHAHTSLPCSSRVAAHPPCTAPPLRIPPVRWASPNPPLSEQFIQRDFDLVSAMSKGGWATRGAPGNVIKSKP